MTERNDGNSAEQTLAPTQPAAASGSAVPPAQTPADLNRPSQSPRTAQASPPTPSTRAPALKQPSVSLGPIGQIETLTPEQQLQLQTYEAVISDGWRSFVDVGKALTEIRNLRLYVEYDTFENYCRIRWSYNKRYANRLISAAEITSELRESCPEQPPDHESQIRPLEGLAPEQYHLAWHTAIQRAQGHPITAQLVRNVVKTLELSPATAEPVQEQAAPPAPRINKAEVAGRINNALAELVVLAGQKAAHDVLRERLQAVYHEFQQLVPRKPKR